MKRTTRLFACCGLAGHPFDCSALIFIKKRDIKHL
jgi:hypothetical protein